MTTQGFVLGLILLLDAFTLARPTSRARIERRRDASSITDTRISGTEDALSKLNACASEPASAYLPITGTAARTSLPTASSIGNDPEAEALRSRFTSSPALANVRQAEETTRYDKSNNVAQNEGSMLEDADQHDTRGETTTKATATLLPASMHQPHAANKTTALPPSRTTDDRDTTHLTVVMFCIGSILTVLVALIAFVKERFWSWVDSRSKAEPIAKRSGILSEDVSSPEVPVKGMRASLLKTCVSKKHRSRKLDSQNSTNRNICVERNPDCQRADSASSTDVTSQDIVAAASPSPPGRTSDVTADTAAPAENRTS